MTELMLFFAASALLVSVIIAYPFMRRAEWKTVLLLIVWITAASLGAYSWVGSPRLDEHRAALENSINQNRAAVDKNPNDLTAWASLAAALAESGDYAGASNAFRKCVLLSKGDPSFIAAYAESLILLDNGIVGEQAERSINIALMIKPELPLARYYKAMLLVQQNKPDEAMPIFKKLYSELPENSPIKARLNAQIGRSAK